MADKYPHELSGGCGSAWLCTANLHNSLQAISSGRAFSALDELTKMELHAWYLDIHRRLGLTTPSHYS